MFLKPISNRPTVASWKIDVLSNEWPREAFIIIIIINMLT